MTQITQSELIRLVTYDANTGVIAWRVQRGPNAVGRVADCHDHHGYIVVRVNRVLYKAHRLAWLYTYGEWPEDELDHINRVRNDNRIANLRLSDRARNPKNTGMFCTNTSGVKGVSFHKASRLWHARIYDKNRCISLGFYDTLAAAAVARAAAEEKYGYRA